MTVYAYASAAVRAAGSLQERRKKEKKRQKTGRMTDCRFVDKEVEMAVKVGVKVGWRLERKICIAAHHDVVDRSPDRTSV